MPDILFILLLALVIFGPKRLPEVARQIAKFMAQFRMMRDDVRRQIENEILKIELEDKKKTPLPAYRQPEIAQPFEVAASPAPEPIVNPEPNLVANASLESGAPPEAAELATSPPPPQHRAS